MGYVPTSNLSAWFANTEPGQVADATKIDPAVQDIVNTVNENYDYVTGLISAGTLSKLGIVNPKDFGAKGDGIANDTNALQNSINAIATTGGTVIIPPGTYRVTSTLNIGSNISIIGSGRDSTKITTDSGVSFHVIKSSSSSFISVRDLSIIGGGKASSAQWEGIRFDNCQYAIVQNVFVQNVDSVGVKLIDCDYCKVENCDVEYPDDRFNNEDAGYAVMLDGCGHCSIANCSALQVSFGFVIIGNDLPGGTNGTESQRAQSFATSNSIVGCKVNYHHGHAFDLNAVFSTVVSACSSNHYVSSSSPTRPAFQNKHSNSDESRANVFIGCTAENCGSGFYSQDGTHVLFNGCTVRNAAYHGVWVNSCPFSVITSIIIDGFYGNAIFVQGSSTGILVDSISARATDNVATTGVRILGSNSCVVGGFLLRGTFFRSLYIDSASNNAMITRGFRTNNQTVEDLSTTTIYPVQYQAELDMVSASTITMGVPQRGMYVTRVRFATTVSITNTIPSINVGRIGDGDQIVINGSPSASSNSIVSPAIASSILGSGQIITASTSGGAGAGKVLISVDGLELL